ncbi:hypothetical protein [Dechloromonas sp. ZS-1]|uniref:hypothetical protein n=1 Tax=Dechloromonas sp. ZS-1 TaxID=3138067 RepID=UPI0031FCE3F8
MSRKISFPVAEQWIEDQLSDRSSHRSLFQSATGAYAEMQIAIVSEGARSSLSVTAAGVFGGFIKTWKAGLIASITKDIIQKLEIDVSRERIRTLQFDIFGRSQASKDLKNYAIERRNGGGRAAPLPEVPDSLKADAYQFFLCHEDDLKLAVHNRQ